MCGGRADANLGPASDPFSNSDSDSSRCRSRRLCAPPPPPCHLTLPHPATLSCACGPSLLFSGNTARPRGGCALAPDPRDHAQQEGEHARQRTHADRRGVALAAQEALVRVRLRVEVAGERGGVSRALVYTAKPLNADAPSYRPGSSGTQAAHRVAIVHPSCESAGSRQTHTKQREEDVAAHDRGHARTAPVLAKVGCRQRQPRLSRTHPKPFENEHGQHIEEGAVRRAERRGYHPQPGHVRRGEHGHLGANKHERHEGQEPYLVSVPGSAVVQNAAADRPTTPRGCVLFPTASSLFEPAIKVAVMPHSSAPRVSALWPRAKPPPRSPYGMQRRTCPPSKSRAQPFGDGPRLQQCRSLACHGRHCS